MSEKRRDGFPPIFIGGAGRSGTTLLRVILDSHPNIACGLELKLTEWVVHARFNFASFVKALNPPLREYHLTPEDINTIFAQMLLSFMENYRKAVGKRRVAEKSPNNVFFFEHLAVMFPDSPLIHVIRDGRDVVCSLLTMDWPDIRTGKPLDYTRDIRKAAEYWVSSVEAGKRALGHPTAKQNYLELKYEHLVENPEATLRHLFEFIGEPWDPAVMNYHQHEHSVAGESSAEQVSKPLYKTAARRWVRDLKAGDKDIVKSIAGELLIELEYAEDLNW